MKINLAILSSDVKSIKFIKQLGLDKFCNLYANCSRNVVVAEKFSKDHNFLKYYGSYEDLLEDHNIDLIINFLPSGIKFEYSYLSLKKGFRVITDYPVVNSFSDLNFYNEIITNDLISSLFLIDETNIKNLYNQSQKKQFITYYKKIDKFKDQDNSLSEVDILFELCPDLFFFINQYKKSQIKINLLNLINDKITNKISYLNSIISIDTSIQLQVILDNANIDNNHLGYQINKPNKINDFIFNKEELINFIKTKKPFDNLSVFQYYPFKLFQEVFNE